VAAQLARRAIAQDGLKHARHPNAFAFGFPKMLKLLWLKSPFARKLPGHYEGQGIEHKVKAEEI